jgi:hypothetical protein
MGGINRVHGKAFGGASSNVTGSAGAFFSGYQPLMLVVSGTGVGSADTQATPTSAIVEGNRTKTLKTIQNFASIVMIDSASSANSVACIIDGASANRSDGANEVDGVFNALAAAVHAATGNSISVSVNYSEILLSNGNFDL